MKFSYNILVALVAALSASFVSAQTYPYKPIRVIVPVPAGGTPDVMARLVTPGLAAQLGQPLVVDNRGGAGGSIGVELAAKATPDGYTLLVSSPGPLTILPHLRKKVPYETLKDLAPIGMISFGPFLLIANPSVQARTLRELIALAKTQPDKLNYASAGNGSANHLAMELFKSMAGVRITHVPYKGAPQAVSDVLAGHMNLMFNSIAPVLPHIRAGRLRVYGVAADQRSAVLPDVPTIEEAGVPGYRSGNWFGLLAPARTPKAVIARLNQSLVTVVHEPRTRTRFENLGAHPVGNRPEAFAAFIREEYEKYAKVVKLAGARVD